MRSRPTRAAPRHLSETPPSRDGSQLFGDASCSSMPIGGVRVGSRRTSLLAVSARAHRMPDVPKGSPSQLVLEHPRAVWSVPGLPVVRGRPLPTVRKLGLRIGLTSCGLGGVCATASPSVAKPAGFLSRSAGRAIASPRSPAGGTAANLVMSSRLPPSSASSPGASSSSAPPYIQRQQLDEPLSEQPPLHTIRKWDNTSKIARHTECQSAACPWRASS